MNSDQKSIFKRRFHAYYPMLCKIAYGYIPDKDECEDIVQETFISLWNSEKELLSEKEFRSYMIISVRNKSISYLRKQRLDIVSMEDSEHAVTIGYVTDTEGADPDEISSEEKLQQVLSILPPKCREVFMMSKLHGMKYREIAKELDLSEKTVENQMGKAIKTLREFVCSHPLFILIITFVSIFINNILR